MDAAKTWSIRRGIALFLGGFSLLNALGGVLRPGFDANGWWLDLRLFPRPVIVAALAWSGLVLLAFGIQPRLENWRRRITFATFAFLAAVAAINAIIVLWILARGEIRSDFPIPFSLLIVGAVGFLAMPLLKNVIPLPGQFRLAWVGITVLVCATAFPLMQMFCFGLSDYRRPADAAVVFGARTYRNGQPSQALADRVCTACALYREGTVHWLIFSGGPGEGSTTETAAMRTLAISLGVPDSAILCDPEGLDTAATVANTIPLLDKIGAHRVLAVSTFYHLPRIKLAFGRAGLDVLTVPATESHVLTGMPKLMAREVIGLWEYYLDPLLPTGIRMRS